MRGNPCMLILFLVVATMAQSADSSAADFFPWTLNHRWVYGHDDGRALAVSVVSLGTDGSWAGLRIAMSGADGSTWLTYWIKGAGGSLSLNSAVSEPPHYSMVIPGTVFPGTPILNGSYHSSGHCEVSDTLTGYSYSGFCDMYFRITAAGDVTVPAGTFFAYMTDYGWWLQGWRFNGWVDGIGPLFFQSSSGDRFSLLQQGQITPIESASWGAIKQLYR